MSKNNRNSWITGGVVALSALALGTAAFTYGDDTPQPNDTTNKNNELNAQSKEDTANNAKKDTKEKDTASTEENSSENIQAEIARQDKQKETLISEEVPFANRIREGFYVVQEGDTLAHLSEATTVPESVLRTINGIHPNTDIRPGWNIAATPDAVQAVQNEGSVPNLAQQEGAGNIGQETYNVPLPYENEETVETPAVPVKDTPEDTDVPPVKDVEEEKEPSEDIDVPEDEDESDDAIPTPPVEEPEEPAPLPELDEDDIKEDVDVDEDPEIIDSEEGSDEKEDTIIEETDETDGESSESNEDIGHEDITPTPDVPEEGTIDPGTPGESIIDEDIIDEIITGGEDITPPTDENPSDTEEDTEPPVETTPEVTVTTKSHTVTTPLHAGTEHRHDPTLAYGETREVAGQDGYTQEIYEITLENGVEVNRVHVDTVEVPATNRVVYHGTYVEPVTKTTKENKVETILEHGRIVRTNNALPKGESRVVQEGQNGLRTEIYHEFFENDVLTDTVLVDTLVQPSVPEIVEIGTYAVEKRTDTVSQNVRLEAPTEPIITYTDELPKGQHKVQQKARDGVKVVNTEVYYEDDVEVGRQVVSEVVEQAPQQAIILVGTHVAEPVIESRVVTEDESIEAPTTPVIEYSDDLRKGEEKVVQEATPGTAHVFYEVTYEDGVEISREEIGRRVVEDAQAQRIVKGTRVDVTTDTYTEQVTNPAPTESNIVYSDELPIGEDVIHDAQDEIVDLTIEITYENDVEVGRTIVDETVVQEGRPETIVKGTKAPEAETTTETVTETSEQPVETQTLYNPYLNQNVRYVQAEGTPAVVEQTIEITYKDGVEVSREVINENVMQEGTPTVIYQGTQEDLRPTDIAFLDLSEEERYARAHDVMETRYDQGTFPTANGSTLTGEVTAVLTEQDIYMMNEGFLIDEVLLNQYLLEFVNADRAKHNVAPLVLDESLRHGTNVRAQELADGGGIKVLDPETGKIAVDEFGEPYTHVRPYNEETGEYAESHTAFEYRNEYPEYVIGENLAARTYNGNPYSLVSEKHLAEVLYDQWKSSPGHYANMMSDMYTGTWVSVKVGDFANFASPNFMFIKDNITAVQILAVDTPQ